MSFSYKLLENTNIGFTLPLGLKSQAIFVCYGRSLKWQSMYVKLLLRSLVNFEERDQHTSNRIMELKK
ncbi:MULTISPECIES: hypothetical protein [Cyanophyceae]|uniref:hypothetical protein n=1 Tax=Cyanophyceae TaxID=3028117 RepID=UPI0016831007|nr:hypothetical protein [Trichocoleus sp. FACHB-40]MBD2003925.1 hypothetical protein [Trichocoleus sp. FACHB-40]